MCSAWQLISITPVHERLKKDWYGTTLRTTELYVCFKRQILYVDYTLEFLNISACAFRCLSQVVLTHKKIKSKACCMLTTEQNPQSRIFFFWYPIFLIMIPLISFPAVYQWFNSILMYKTLILLKWFAKREERRRERRKWVR